MYLRTKGMEIGIQSTCMYKQRQGEGCTHITPPQISVSFFKCLLAILACLFVMFSTHPCDLTPLYTS